MSLCRVTYPCQPTFAAAADFLFRVARAFGFGAATGPARASSAENLSLSLQPIFVRIALGRTDVVGALTNPKRHSLVHGITSFVLVKNDSDNGRNR